MTKRRSVRKLLRKKNVSIDAYLHPDFYCPEMRSYGLLYHPSDIRFPDPNNDPEAVFINTSKTVQSHRLSCAMPERLVIKALGSPFLKINNSKNIPNHSILLYKRRIDKYKTTTQVHLINKRVIMVFEQFSKIFINKVYYSHNIIDSLGLGISPSDKETLISDKGTGPPAPLVFLDPNGGAVRIEESVSIDVKFMRDSLA